MSAPGATDSLEFARAGQQLRGSLPVASLKRLQDVLFDPDGVLQFELRGGQDDRGRPQLRLTVSGTLHLQCQRCLGCLEFPLDLRNALLLVPPGARHDADLDDPDAPDAIEASTQLDIAGLVEDEVLLGLPLAPRHAADACAEQREGRGPAGAAQPESPFARLARLKNSPDTL
jgi:uncharacterized protein